jgi:2-methylcitrate dehydratase PrpD
VSTGTEGSGSSEAAEFAIEFAGYSSTVDVHRLPGAVIDAAKTNLFDILACAVAGISAKGVSDVVGIVADWGGKPEASVWCTGLRVPAHHAALVNGMMAHARDYDDTHDGAVLHAGVSVVPAALAAAEACPGATGADLLAGIAVGLELVCRLGMATTVGIIESGYMYTALFGHFGATAAAARVMRLDTDATINALGIVYSQAAGTHQVTRDAALTKRIQPGFAAKAALISVALARAGIKGARHTFEGVDGLFRTYLHGSYKAEALRAGLGEQFEMLNLSYKPYPCCRFNHSAIKAALEIRNRLPGGSAEIRRVWCGVNRQAYEAVCTPTAMRKAPATIVQAQFSLPYTVACALVHGSVELEDFTESSLRREAVLACAQRIDAYVDEDIERHWSRSVSPALMRVETDAGAQEARVDLPPGDASSPLTREDFDKKFTDCLRASGLSWPLDVSAQLRTRIDGLEAAPWGGHVLAPLLHREMI